MEKNKVSIIIPVYNAEKFIGETIESVISQTYTNWEILILNDMSTDRSYEIIQEYAQKDGRIKVINSEKNIGVVEGRNRLINEADGEYIAFLDADDYWKEDKLEKQIEFMKNKDIAISCTEYTRVTENGKPINEIKIKEEISIQQAILHPYFFIIYLNKSPALFSFRSKAASFVVRVLSFCNAQISSDRRRANSKSWVERKIILLVSRANRAKSLNNSTLLG